MIYTCLVIHTVNSSTGMSCCILNGTLAILAAKCVISIEPNILQSSCSIPQFFSEENSKWPPPKIPKKNLISW